MTTGRPTMLQNASCEWSPRRLHGSHLLVARSGGYRLCAHMIRWVGVARIYSGDRKHQACSRPARSPRYEPQVPHGSMRVVPSLSAPLQATATHTPISKPSVRWCCAKVTHMAGYQAVRAPSIAVAWPASAVSSTRSMLSGVRPNKVSTFFFSRLFPTH